MDLVGLVVLAHDHVFPDVTPVVRASLLIRGLVGTFLLFLVALAIAAILALPFARRQNRRNAEQSEDLS